MSNRSSDSGSQSLAPSQKDTIEYEDVAPEDSASQIESSVSRASRAARKAAAEVRARTAQRRAAKELQIAALRQEVVEMEAEGEKDALDAGDESFERELHNMDALSRRSAPGLRGEVLGAGRPDEESSGGGDKDLLHGGVWTSQE